IRPQQGRHQRRRQNQQSAHRRRSGFGPVRLRPLGANHLADLKLAQLAHEPWAERQADRERRQRRRRRAERDVARPVPHGEAGAQENALDQEWVQHQPRPARSAFNRSTTRSVFTPRDPLTSTRSPAATIEAAASAASSLVAKYRTFAAAMPAPMAASAIARAA